MTKMKKMILKNIRSDAEKAEAEIEKFEELKKVFVDAEMCKFSPDDNLRLLEILNCLSSLKTAFERKLDQDLDC